MNKLVIIIAYVLAIAACVLIIEALVCAATGGDADFAGYLAGLACFCLLLGIWANVCS